MWHGLVALHRMPCGSENTAKMAVVRRNMIFREVEYI